MTTTYEAHARLRLAREELVRLGRQLAAVTAERNQAQALLDVECAKRAEVEEALRAEQDRRADHGPCVHAAQADHWQRIAGELDTRNDELRRAVDRLEQAHAACERVKWQQVHA